VIAGNAVQVVPEKAFDDWTGGLGAPFASTKSTVGELWGRSTGAALTDPAVPLTLRSQEVSVEVLGEAAETKVVTTYFNGGSSAVKGDFRMAVPDDAIVSGVSWGRGEEREALSIALAKREGMALSADGPLVEWAGRGFIRGTLPVIASGDTVTIEVTYVEWLPLRYDAAGRGRMQYRYALAGPPDAPPIAELGIRLDASAVKPTAIAAGLGAKVAGAQVSLRRPDYRPSADFVVDLVVPPFESKARMYVASGSGPGEPRTVLVRVDLPEPTPAEGATLVLVLDTSGSSEPGQLEVARGFVRAVMDALGPRDKLAVVAGDQSVRAVGPKEAGFVTPERRAEISKALDELSPGGATDLSDMLDHAAGLVAAEASAMVVYVGDGYATAGESDAEKIVETLTQRPAGLPRMSAVGVGPVVNVRALSTLARSAGRYFAVQDSVEAAGAATALIEHALVPAVSNVEVDLGPDVEQVYPRTRRSVPLGEPFLLVGKLRGMAPSAAVVRFRHGGELKEERRLLAWRTAPRTDDVARRWAQARVDDVLRTGKGREAVTDVALSVGLLTPWTAFHQSSAPYTATHPAVRLLTPEHEADFTFGRHAVRGAVLSASLTGDSEGSAGDLSSLVSSRVGARLEEAYREIGACRNSRAAGRPELRGRLQVQLEVDGDGRAKNVRVRGQDRFSEDASMNQCIELALAALSYPEGGLSVVVNYELVLPAPKRTRAAKCSEASKTALPYRRGVWHVRLSSEDPLAVYMSAKSSCELRSWADRRALLELMLLARSDGVARVALSVQLRREGEADAADFVRKETVRRARSPQELAAIRSSLLGAEQLPWPVFVKAYKTAAGDAARLSVVRRFLTIAPHDPRLRARLVALLESSGDKSALLDEARRARSDAFAPVELLAEIASALRRIKAEHQALRTFGEIAERAPFDPWARAYLGDRLMNEGYSEAATGHYAVLESLAPDDPAVIVRLARANAEAGRIDVARRLLVRVVETGGRDGNADVAHLAGQLASVLLAEARTGKHPKEILATLEAHALELPRELGRVALLVRAPGGMVALKLSLTRSGPAGKDIVPADVTAASAGLYLFSFDASAEQVTLEVERPEELEPAPALPVVVTALSIGDKADAMPSVVSVPTSLGAGGKPKEVRWKQGALTL
jgi:tetratricopeptide (TPR) repeat protein